MYAIVKVGNSQFKVSEGDVINAHRLKEESGKKIILDKVLLFAKGTDIRVGQPYLNDVKVTAQIVRHDLGEKQVAVKYRRRKNSATKIGHRQQLTALNITKIDA